MKVRPLEDRTDYNTPSCPRCYLETGKTEAMLWDLEYEEWRCPLHGADELDKDPTMSAQYLIDTGMAWRMEGSVGRECMRLIEAGFCTVGQDAHFDYYGNRVPAIKDLEPGSMGTPEYVERKTRERDEE